MEEKLEEIKRLIARIDYLLSVKEMKLNVGTKVFAYDISQKNDISNEIDKLVNDLKLVVANIAAADIIKIKGDLKDGQ